MLKKENRSILESWPMIKEDFEAFTKDPTCWFINHMDSALAEENLEAIGKLMEIFKIVNLPSEGHNH